MASRFKPRDVVLAWIKKDELRVGEVVGKTPEGGVEIKVPQENKPKVVPETQVTPFPPAARR